MALGVRWIPRALPWAGIEPRRWRCRVRRVVNRVGVDARPGHRLWRKDFFDGLTHRHRVVDAQFNRPKGACHESPGQRPGEMRQTTQALKGRSKTSESTLCSWVRMVGPPFQGWINIVRWIPRALPWAGIDRAFGAGDTRIRAHHACVNSPPRWRHPDSRASRVRKFAAPKGHATKAQGNALGTTPINNSKP